jgi:hypothetical protein
VIRLPRRARDELRGRHQPLEGIAQRRQIAGAGGRQFQAARAALEQHDAEILLELLDQAADRALRDMQLPRGAGEAQMPPGDLEGAQGVERGQAVGRLRKTHGLASLNRLSDNRQSL